jgi:hypothetical protein
LGFAASEAADSAQENVAAPIDIPLLADIPFDGMPHPLHLGKPRWWQWLTVLSLDAPAVALAWQWMFARIAGAALGWRHYFVLGAGVWLIYAADRWIEGWRIDAEKIATQRHFFYMRRRWAVFALWLVVFGGFFAVLSATLTPREWLAGGPLGAAVLAYLFSHQFLHRHSPWRTLKEICIAVLFSAGTCFFPATVPHTAFPLAAAILFAFLCFANCLLIAIWETEVDTLHAQTSLPLRFATARSLGRWLPWGIFCASVLLWPVFHGSRAALACAGGSGILLGAVDASEPVLGRQLCRVLADAVLLTPLAFGWRA